ncbi:MAG TPA: hypothetical protein VF794_30885 [Archangium sp.]|jgi:hypothetical protein|uniref:LA_2272 family surface repeat-containing protein n=1 Tax=Archangium sp. TaxID=1872627 RepID=UPI002EDA0BA7
MKRDVSVWAGVLAAVVSVSAGAEEPAPPRQDVSAEVHRPFNFSLLPGIGTNGFSSGNVVNNLSLGVFATHAGRVDGLAAAMVGNWVDGELRGLGMAMGANYAGQVRGMQFALGGNVAGGSMRGWQTAVGVNVASGELVGAQVAVGLNIAAGPSRGLQASSGINIARHLEGGQLSLLNVGGEVSGAQVGLINVARRMKGLQLGLINVAREAEGANLGLLNFVGNGQHHVQVWASDLSMTNVALKFGGKYFHTLFTVGLRPGREGQRRWWAAGMGFGAHIPFGPLFLDLDALASSLHEGRLISPSGNLLGQLRLLGGWQPFSHFAVFGGVTVNSLVNFHGEEPRGMDRWGQGFVYSEDAVRVRTWPGLVAGVQL